MVIKTFVFMKYKMKQIQIKSFWKFCDTKLKPEF